MVSYFRRIPTYVITIHQRHRQTDRGTDRRHAIAIPRFALKCIAHSRGKNDFQIIVPSDLARPLTTGETDRQTDRQTAVSLGGPRNNCNIIRDGRISQRPSGRASTCSIIPFTSAVDSGRTSVLSRPLCCVHRRRLSSVCNVKYCG